MKKGFLLFAAAALLMPLSLSAQFSIFPQQTQSKNKKGPTKINSDAMDIDMANDKATFMGNVVVDNPDMYLTCRRMVVHLYNPRKKAASKDPDKKITGGKKISHIECFEDVSITMKSNNKIEDSQKALAGHANYSMIHKTVTLTEKPILINGASRVTGERITLHIGSSRVEIVNGRILSSELGDSNP